MTNTKKNDFNTDALQTNITAGLDHLQSTYIYIVNAFCLESNCIRPQRSCDTSRWLTYISNAIV